jgi:hypothetical protein
MKTIEEKAKAYDEALERANSLLSSNELGNAWIYKLLPELKESEGEEIRKEIISALKNANCKGVYDKHLAWLEKQGEQKPAWSKEDDKILKSIIINIENLQFSEEVQEKYHHIPNANKSYYQIKIDWLKSLKDRIQPKQ